MPAPTPYEEIQDNLERAAAILRQYGWTCTPPRPPEQDLSPAPASAEILELFPNLKHIPPIQPHSGTHSGTQDSDVGSNPAETPTQMALVRELHILQDQVATGRVAGIVSAVIQKTGVVNTSMIVAPGYGYAALGGATLLQSDIAHTIRALNPAPRPPPFPPTPAA